MIRKIILTFIVLIFVIIATVAFNVPFLVWPTFINDHEIKISEEIISRLTNLKNEKKFIETQKVFYPGAPNETIRVEAENLLNNLIQEIIDGVKQNPRKSFVLKTIKSNMPYFDKFDSEERDMFCYYCEEIIEILGISSSGRLINVWRYGIPYKRLSNKPVKPISPHGAGPT
jgi:hypothetical protein